MHDFSIDGPGTDCEILELSSEDIDLVCGGANEGKTKPRGWIGRILIVIETIREVIVNRREIANGINGFAENCEQNSLECFPPSPRF